MKTTVIAPGLAPGRCLHTLLLGALVLFGLATRPSSVDAAGKHGAMASRAFWVARSSGWTHLSYSFVARGAHVRVYALPYTLSPHIAEQIAAMFDGGIYATDTSIFGLPRRLTPVDIVLTPLDRLVLGYFDQNDVSPFGAGGDPRHSNYANVLYVRQPQSMPDRNKMDDVGEVMAHELQHLIEFRLRAIDRHLVPETDWLNEGLSFYAQLANGYWTPRDVLKIQAASRTPSWPVTLLNEGPSFLESKARLAYGRAGAFSSYLAERFGPNLIRDLVGSSLVGMPAVQGAIHSIAPRLDLRTVYGDWCVAQELDGNGKYGYGPLARHFRLPPTLAFPPVATYPFTDRGNRAGRLSLQPWGQAFVRFTTRDNAELRLSVRGPAGLLRVAAVLQDSNGVVAPRVQWLRFRGSGNSSLRVANFGGFYDRVTLAISYVPGSAVDGTTIPAAIDLRAQLVDVSDHNRTAGLAAPASRDRLVAVRQIRDVYQPFTIGRVNPRSSRVTAGNA